MQRAWEGSEEGEGREKGEERTRGIRGTSGAEKRDEQESIVSPKIKKKKMGFESLQLHFLPSYWSRGIQLLFSSLKIPWHKRPAADFTFQQYHDINTTTRRTRHPTHRRRRARPSQESCPPACPVLVRATLTLFVHPHPLSAECTGSGQHLHTIPPTVTLQPLT